MPLFPRLDDGPAVQHLLELEGAGPEPIADHAGTTHPRQYFFTPGEQVSEPRLSELQDDLRSTAAHAGYPDGGSPSSRSDFDVTAGQRLVQEEIEDVGARGVWTFLGCVLVPDVIAWRWGWRREEAQRAPLRRYERYLGSHRNALRRCWYRCHHFGWGGGAPVDGVWEDAIVGVEERPSLGADGRVAEAVFGLAVQLFPESMAYERREDAFRRGVKRLRERAAVIELRLLSDEQLVEIVREELAE